MAGAIGLGAIVTITGTLIALGEMSPTKPILTRAIFPETKPPDQKTPKRKNDDNQSI
jgi:hypothetical protein